MDTIDWIYVKRWTTRRSVRGCERRSKPARRALVPGQPVGGARGAGAALLSAALLLAGCSAVTERLPGFLRPYRPDVQQGNVITSDMVDQLRPGMTRDQVKFMLGTPLLADAFHPDRWDYMYYLKPRSGPTQRRNLVIYFKDNHLEHFHSDPMPPESMADNLILGRKTQWNAAAKESAPSAAPAANEPRTEPSPQAASPGKEPPAEAAPPTSGPAGEAPAQAPERPSAPSSGEPPAEAASPGNGPASEAPAATAQPATEPTSEPSTESAPQATAPANEPSMQPDPQAAPPAGDAPSEPAAQGAAPATSQ